MGQLIKLTKFDIRLNTLYYLSLRAPRDQGRGGTDPKMHPDSWFYMFKRKSAEKLAGFDGAPDQIDSLT